MKSSRSKSVFCIVSLFFCFTLFSREANLINNSTFAYGMKCWKYIGSTPVEKLARGIRISGGTLMHYIDLGNLEHAQPDCAAPAGRQFRFRIRAKSKGKFHLGVRSRLMYGGNALEFAETESGFFELKEDWQNFDFESVSVDPDTAFHDKLTVHLAEGTEMEIVSSSFFYLDVKGPELVFEPSAAAVRPGDTVKLSLYSSEPERKFTCSLYTGQFLPGGYFPAKHWETTCGKDGRADLTFTVPFEAPDGVRLSVRDLTSGVKADFFATILPEKMLHRYRKYAENISGRQHFLFLGDSLSDYDRGRNYISLLTCFLPPEYSVRNCVVGGDTLLRIRQRLNGEKTVRNEMYDQIFSPKPDTIFILAGANDSKLMSRNDYQTYVPENEQIALWDEIVAALKKKSGAKIVLITAPDSYMPYQKALYMPLKAKKYNHSIFGIPEVHDRFNARLRQIAGKHGLDVIDFAAAVRRHPDPQELYVQDDGVHLSLKGHQLLCGEILNYLATGKMFQITSAGEKSLTGELSFRGNDRIRILNSSDINADKNGLTVITAVTPCDNGTDKQKDASAALDMYVFKDRQFFLGRYENRLYANFHDGVRYCGHTMSVPGNFPESGRESQAAVVFEPRSGGCAVKLFLNGVPVGEKVFPGKFPESNRNFIELGSGWGGPWHYRREINGVWTFSRALSDVEIRCFFEQQNKRSEN